MERWPLVRDVVLFATGIGLIINESFRHGTERPTLLLLYAAMIGLPAFLNTDERRNGKKNGDR